MATPDTIFADKIYTGAVTFSQAPTLPADTISNDTHVKTGINVQVAKLEHLFKALLAQEAATLAANDNKVVHHVQAAGTVLEFKAGCVVSAIGDSTVAVDLLKNGVSILSAAISLAAADPAAYGQKTATISSAAVVADDELSIKFTVTAGTGTLPKGIWAQVRLKEKYA